MPKYAAAYASGGKKEKVNLCVVLDGRRFELGEGSRERESLVLEGYSS